MTRPIALCDQGHQIASGRLCKQLSYRTGPQEHVLGSLDLSEAVFPVETNRIIVDGLNRDHRTAGDIADLQ
jgi:hypothetical protein